jgi:hypothetical protein
MDRIARGKRYMPGRGRSKEGYLLIGINNVKVDDEKILQLSKSTAHPGPGGIGWLQ